MFTSNIQSDPGDGAPGRSRTTADRPESLRPPPSTWKNTVRAAWGRNRGPGLVILAQLFAALMNVTTKVLETEGHGLQAPQILFARMSITFVLSTVYMWWANVKGFPFGDRNIRRLLHVRGISGFFSAFGLYYSLQYLPLAEATVITFLAPIVACWACAIFIHEPFTRKEQMAGLISLVGVCLIARPMSLLPHGWNSGPVVNETIDNIPLVEPRQAHEVPLLNRITSAQRLSGVGMGLMGVLNAAIAFTSIRWIGKRAHPLLSVNYLGAWTVLASTLIQFYPSIGFRLPSSLCQWGLLLFLGVCGFVMQILFTAGLQQEKSSRATNMVYTQMVFALVLDKLVWNSTLSILSIIGSSIILSSAIYIAMQNSARVSAEFKLEGKEDEELRYMLHDESSPVHGVLVEAEEDGPVWRTRTG